MKTPFSIALSPSLPPPFPPLFLFLPLLIHLYKYKQLHRLHFSILFLQFFFSFFFRLAGLSFYFFFFFWFFFSALFSALFLSLTSVWRSSWLTRKIGMVFTMPCSGKQEWLCQPSFAFTCDFLGQRVHLYSIFFSLAFCIFLVSVVITFSFFIFSIFPSSLSFSLPLSYAGDFFLRFFSFSFLRIFFMR